VRAVQHQARGIVGVELTVEIDQANANAKRPVSRAPNPGEIGFEQTRDGHRLNIICGLDVGHAPRKGLTVKSEDLRMQAPTL